MAADVPVAELWARLDVGEVGPFTASISTDTLVLVEFIWGMTMVDVLTDTSVGALSRTTEITQAYRNASPWPHVVVKDLVPRDLIAEAYEQEICRVEQMQRASGPRSRKVIRTEGFGPAVTQIYEILDSPQTLAFLESVTGVQGLLVDPTRAWAGLQANLPGDYHLLHRDFVRHPHNWLWHRVNVLVYLAPEWRDEWGGGLELWGRGASAPGAIVRPEAPNSVIFDVSGDAIHGLPEPVCCPPGLARLSVAAYYYSSTPPPRRGRYHPVMWRPRRPEDRWREGFATRGEIAMGLEMRAKDEARTVYHWLRDHRP